MPETGEPPYDYQYLPQLFDEVARRRLKKKDNEMTNNNAGAVTKEDLEERQIVTLRDACIAAMTKDEISTLLYLEERAVNRNGRVHMAHMNEGDRKIAEAWHESKFLEFGRIRFSDCTSEGTHYVHLSDEAYQVVAVLRQARAERGWKNKHYETTNEARTAP